MHFNSKNIDLYFCLTVPIFYFILLSILGYLWVGYNPIEQSMSEIGAINSPYKDIMNYLGFSFLGLCFLVFSLRLRKELVPTIRSTIIYSSVFVAGFFMFLVGFFPCDVSCIDVSQTGELHSITSTVPAILLPISAIISGSVFSEDTKFNTKLGYSSFILGILSLSTGPLMFIDSVENFSGLFQRVGIGLVLVWIISLSYFILRKN
jgi:hypothetical membrane protein